MAKFCGYCGAEMDDSAKVCGKCGTPFEGKSHGFSNVKAKGSKESKKTKKVMIGIVLIAIVVVASNTIPSFIGTKGLIRKAMAAYEDYDIDALVSMSSNMYFYGHEDSVEYYFEYNIGEDLDTYEEQVGHNYKLSYKIDDVYTPSERKMNEMLDRISSIYSSFDIDTIQKIAIADLTVTAKNSSKSVKSNLQITMSKEKGKWKLLYIE